MASNSISMLATLLFVAIVAGGQFVGAATIESLLRADKQAELTKASELKQLVAGLAASPQDESVYSSRTRMALDSLDSIISSQDDICSPAKITQIRRFYTDFLDKKSLKHQQQDELPKSVKKFFLSYGFGVSRVCKASMISSLSSESNKLLNERDFEKLAKWTSEGGSMAKLSKAPKDVEDLILPADIEAFVREIAGKKGKNVPIADGKISVVLQPEPSRQVRRIQAVCERRFRPIYEQLVLPVVSLSRVGLNYKGDELSGHLEQMKSDKTVHLWFRIVFLCESVKSMEVFEDSEESSNEGDKKNLRLLSKEEADRLRPIQPAADVSDIGEQIDFQVTNHHQLGDLIVDNQDKNIQKLLSKFDTNKSESRGIRTRIVRYILSIFKDYLKTRKFNLFKGLMKRGPKSSLNEELVRALDDYVGQNSPDVSGNGTHTRVKRNISLAEGLFYNFIIVAIGVVIILAVCGVFAG